MGVQYTDLGVDTGKQSGYYDKPREWQTIKSNAGTIIQFASADDPYVPLHEAHTIRDQLGSEYYEFPRKGHFMDVDFPELVQVLKSKMSLTPQVSNSSFSHTVTPASNSSIATPVIEAPVVMPEFHDDEPETTKRSRRSILTRLLPLCVLALLGRLLYQKYFTTPQAENMIVTDTGSVDVLVPHSGDIQEDSLDAFLAEEGITSPSTDTTIVTDTTNSPSTGTIDTNNDMPSIPDLNLEDGTVTNDDMIQVTPISPEELIKIQKQYTDTKKISQFA